ncbi:MAG: VanZ family protein [Erysipelotrichaceae bacterium]|nr:VanZ family protein [Erysipelotrichaceae bacterium]
MTVYFLVILPLPSIEQVAKLTTARIQLIPFTFISDIIKEINKTGNPIYFNKALLQFLFNIVMLIPFGIYLRYYFKKSLKDTIKYTFYLSLFFELTQLSGLYFIYPRSYRLFDVDDLMSNTLGGLFGYFLAKPLCSFLPDRDKIDEHSFRISKKVSTLRRLTALGLDFTFLFLIQIILFICIPFFRDNNTANLFIALILIYYVLTNMIFNGATLGQLVVNIKTVKTDDSNNRFLAALKYILFFIMYIFIPILLFVYTGILCRMYLPGRERFIAYSTVIVLTFLYLSFEFILAITGKRTLIDRLSKTKVVSTFDTTL